MLKDELLRALVCPKCGGEVRQDRPDELVCCQCRQSYPVENNIPIVLANPGASLMDIKQKIRSNPDWYTSEQIDYAEKGPYRHHLRKRVKYLLGIFNGHKSTAPSILDAGCGDGANLRHLITIENATVFGIDNNPVRLLRTQENTKGQAFLVLGDILERVFRDDYFDIVLCNHVLEHIEKDLKVLHNLFAILKPGGLFILGTPNEGAWLWQFQYKVIEPRITRTTDHVHFYTVRTLSELLSEAGFSIKEITFMGWGLPHTWPDTFLRQHRWIDDLFEIIGKRLCKSQATSLYLVCTKG